jgi:hypothetical protein
MAAVEIESRGTRSEIKEQSENIKSLFGGRHFFFLIYIFFSGIFAKCKKDAKMIYKTIDWNGIWKRK